MDVGRRDSAMLVASGAVWRLACEEGDVIELLAGEGASTGRRGVRVYFFEGGGGAAEDSSS